MLPQPTKHPTTETLQPYRLPPEPLRAVLPGFVPVGLGDHQNAPLNAPRASHGLLLTERVGGDPLGDVLGPGGDSACQ